MTIKREELISTALSWLNTPYQHQVGLKHYGVDCAYFVGKVAEETKIIDRFYVEPYSVEWHWHSREEKMCSIIESFGCTQITKEELRPGDILAFKYGRVCSHLGIMLSDNQFVHAHLPARKVIVNSLYGEYLDRLERVYRFPNLED